jgi:hypothetical protein
VVKTDIVEVLTFEVLEELSGIDCSEPKCRTNAVGTGRLLREEPFPEELLFEWRCLDCGCVGLCAGGGTEQLKEALDAAPESEHRRIVAEWVRTRPNRLRPWLSK